MAERFDAEHLLVHVAVGFGQSEQSVSKSDVKVLLESFALTPE